MKKLKQNIIDTAKLLLLFGVITGLWVIANILSNMI